MIGSSGEDWRGLNRRGKARQKRNGMDWQGKDGHGKARQ